MGEIDPTNSPEIFIHSEDRFFELVDVLGNETNINFDVRLLIGT